VSRGPVLTCVQALLFTSRSGGDPLLVAHDISHRAEPDVKPCSPCIYRGEDAPPATVLTGDVPSQYLMCPIPSAGESRLEAGVNRAKLKFTKLFTTTSRVSVRNIIESEREGAKQIASE
jgi:hypothetical protein